MYPDNRVHRQKDEV